MFAQVLERKVGIPITMSTVYEAIARRLGITLLPVSLNIFKWGLCSLVPRPTPVLRFAFTIIHRSGRVAKNGEGLGTQTKGQKKTGRPGNTYQVNDVWWTRGGRRGDGAQLQVCVQ